MPSHFFAARDRRDSAALFKLRLFWVSSSHTKLCAGWLFFVHLFPPHIWRTYFWIILTTRKMQGQKLRIMRGKLTCCSIVRCEQMCPLQRRMSDLEWGLSCPSYLLPKTEFMATGIALERISLTAGIYPVFSRGLSNHFSLWIITN